ncbi:hypothetical protein CTJ15_09905 [Roseomonas sp. FDAARGOS_362]|nr:hypothetical protein CTJ15_09905 [Roseomonas sp. FDAARGOS_362]
MFFALAQGLLGFLVLGDVDDNDRVTKQFADFIGNPVDEKEVCSAVGQLSFIRTRFITAEAG